MKAVSLVQFIPHVAQLPRWLSHGTGLLVLLSLGACSLLGITEKEAEPEQIVTGTGLTYTVLRSGEGPLPGEGDMVRFHYRGQLSDGTVFDSSYERSEPVEVRFGHDKLLPGLEEGIALLREGAKASLVIPPDLAYGASGLGPVPENETLAFLVEILHVLTPERKPEPESEAVAWSETDAGVRYYVTRQGDGMNLSVPMYVSLNYTGYLDDGEQTVFDSSHERKEPLRFVLGANMVIPGWEDVLQEMRVGDAARVWVPYSLAYGKEGRGPIPPETDLLFDIEILDAHTVEPPRPFDTSGRDTLQTESGLRYIMVRPGSGKKPNPGNVLQVHYSAYLSDGTLFDSSVQRSEPLRFVVGTGQVIKGWDEAFFLLPEGTKARLIVPPYLAYGEAGTRGVPSGETLVFDVELLDIQR